MNKHKLKGIAGVGFQVIIGAICTWCVGLSVTAFNDHASIASIMTAIQDIKDTVHDIKNTQDNKSSFRMSSTTLTTLN